jgi:hypothetical protein
LKKASDVSWLDELMAWLTQNLAVDRMIEEGRTQETNNKLLAKVNKLALLSAARALMQEV